MLSQTLSPPLEVDRLVGQSPPYSMDAQSRHVCPASEVGKHGPTWATMVLGLERLTEAWPPYWSGRPRLRGGMPTSSWAWGRCRSLHAHEDVGMPPTESRAPRNREAL